MTKKILHLLQRTAAFTLAFVLCIGSAAFERTVMAADSSVPLFDVTVYWNVEKNNDASGNYFDLTYVYPKIYGYDNNLVSDYSTGVVQYEKVADKSGSHSKTFKNLPGVPQKILYSCWGKFANQSKWYITKITVKPVEHVSGSNIAEEITIWEGLMGAHLKNVGGSSNAITLYFNGHPTFSDWETDKGTDLANRTTTYYNKLSTDYIVPEGITDISFDDDIYVPTNGSKKAYSITKGIVYDQFGAKYPAQEPKESYTTSYTPGVEMSNSALTLTSAANRTDDYSFTFAQEYSFGKKVTKTVKVHTFDYNVTFKDASGNTLKTQTVDYGKSAEPPTAPSAIYKNGKIYKFSGWSGDSYTDIKDGAQNRTVTAAYNTNAGFFSGSGTEGSPYLIQSKADWELLGEYCKLEDTNGKYFKLTKDISVDTSIGVSNHDFDGIFDGGGKALTLNISSDQEGAAPFHYAAGNAVIKNLNVGGKVSSSAKFASGLIGQHWGNVTVENCRVSAEINSTVSGDGTNGSFVGLNNKNSTLTIKGCVFDGKLIGSETNCWGGFVGWRKGSVNISDCVFAPSQLSIDTTSSENFVRNGATITNCYYTQALNGTQGKLLHSVTAADGAIVNFGSYANKYSVSNINAYGAGLEYNGQFYAGSGDKVAVTLSNNIGAGYTVHGYSVTLTDGKFTMPDHNVVITPNVNANQYTISFDTDGGSGIMPITQDYGSAVTAPANPTKTGYTFAGWDTAIPATMPNQNITIKAKWTVNQYTITFDTDGGSEISPITQNYGTPVTAPANPTKTNYVFDEWDRSIPETMPAENITIKAKWTPDPAHFTQDGDIYIIRDTAGWNIFCDCLQDNDKYNRFIGKTVKLYADIKVTRMAGSSKHDFMGTFDGQRHTLTVNYGSSASPISENNAAPFCNVENGCIIENLHTAGTIYSSKKYASGIVGTQYSGVTIRNCRSSVTINSLTSGDGTHGGFVGLNGNSNASKLTVEGCVFDGKLLGESTNACSGFVGYKSNNGNVTITNSIYAPAAAVSGETEVSDTNCATFVRNGSAGTNCYYTRTLGDAQGKAAHTVTAGENVTIDYGTGTEYNVSGITAYSTGLVYNNNFYAGEGDEVTMTLGYNGTLAEEYIRGGYSVNAGTLNGNILTMPDEDVTISPDFELAPAKIGTKYYGTVQEAFDAAQEGDTVTLLRDVKLPDGTVNNSPLLQIDKSITLDLNGKILEGKATEESSAISLTSADVTLTLKGGGTIKETNGARTSTIRGTYDNGKYSSIVISGGDTFFTVDGSLYGRAVENCDLIVNGGSVTANACIENGNAIIINDGAVAVNTASDLIHVSFNNFKEIKLNGGFLTTNKDICVRAGQVLTLAGGTLNANRIDVKTDAAVSVAPGYVYSDGTNTYSGGTDGYTFTSNELSALAGKTLTPVDDIVTIGDVNFDGIVNDADAALVLKYISTNEPFFADDEEKNAKAMIAANADGIGGIDMLDVIKILQIAEENKL